MPVKLDYNKNYLIYGIDEAGRGPLCGPVVAACVYIPEDARRLEFWGGVTDSKKLSAKKREILFPLIQEHCVFGIAEASAAEIDDRNIHHATLLAMKRAFNQCYHSEHSEESFALIDGKFCPDISCPAEAVVKGDSKVLEIGAASILAKVTRDHLMARLHTEYPHYGWDHNSGYGTPEHLAALAQHGPTPHHRQSFAPVRQYKVAV